jgi:hypothetical protein
VPKVAGKIASRKRYLQQTDNQVRMQVMELIKPAFDIYRNEDAVRFNAACWVVTA